MDFAQIQLSGYHLAMPRASIGTLDGHTIAMVSSLVLNVMLVILLVV